MLSEPGRGSFEPDRTTHPSTDSPVSFDLPSTISRLLPPTAAPIETGTTGNDEDDSSPGWLLWLAVIPLVIGFTGLVVGPLLFSFF
jgi:hypothetical protein